MHPSRERDFAGLQLSAVRRRSALLDAAADFRTVADFRKDHLAALEGVDKEAKANLTDPQSRIMKTRRGWLQGYNGQAMAGCGSQVIVAHGVTQAENAGLEDKTTELFIATKKDWKQRQAQREQEAPRGRIPSNATLRERMERKLLTKRGRKAYKKRGATIEPVFGQMAMRGLNRFWLRGIGKVKGEWPAMAAACPPWRRRRCSGFQPLCAHGMAAGSRYAPVGRMSTPERPATVAGN